MLSSLRAIPQRIPVPFENRWARRSMTASASSTVVKVDRSWYRVTEGSEKMVKIASASAGVAARRKSRPVSRTGTGNEWYLSTFVSIGEVVVQRGSAT